MPERDGKDMLRELEEREEFGAREFIAPMAHSVRTSMTIGKVAEALAKAQLTFEPVKKDTVNPYYGSMYAVLASVISATQKSLAENGLVIIQMPQADIQNRRMTLTTMLVHSSGEWIASDLTLPAEMMGKDKVPRFDSQSLGSAMTYARRYAYQALIGVSAEPDDDDANATLGSKELSQAVADKKLAQYEKTKRVEQKFEPQGEEGYGKIQAITEFQNPAKTRRWLKVIQSGWPLTIFDNHKFEEPVDGHPDLFSFLLASEGKDAQFEIALVPQGEKIHHNIIVKDADIRIGEQEFHNGVPSAIQRG